MKAGWGFLIDYTNCRVCIHQVGEGGAAVGGIAYLSLRFDTAGEAARAARLELQRQVEDAQRRLKVLEEMLLYACYMSDEILADELAARAESADQ